MYVQLITAELASATGKASFFAALESACVELYLVRTEADNPASVIFDTCEKHGRMRWLFEWVLEVIDPLDTCVNDEVSDNSKRQLLLADCVFELAGMLDYESRESNWDRAVASLATVWSRHGQWRKCANRVFSTINCSGWVDPATSAEESLLLLYRNKPDGRNDFKTVEQIKVHIDEIVALPEESYAHAMRDYCLHFYLVHLCERSKPADGVVRHFPESYSNAIGWVFGKTGARWLRTNPWLLELLFFSMKTISDSDWPSVAEQMYLHTKNTLTALEQSTLRDLLGVPDYTDNQPDLESLYNQFETNRRSSVVRFKGVG